MSAAMEQAQQQAQRPRANTRFSFRSDKSNELHHTKSKQSKHERKVSDSERLKTHYDPTTKANPNAAMNEAQPSTSCPYSPPQSAGGFQQVYTDVCSRCCA
jgi:hypothetical protein